MRLVLIITILILSACATQTVDKRQNNQAAIKFVHGKDIYVQNCLPCHGGNGKGAFPGISDLTQVKVFKSSSTSNELLFQYIEPIKKGVKSSNGMYMPPKGGNPNLTDQDIKEVLQYMREKFSSK